MKRIEAIVQSEMSKKVVNAVAKVGVGGVTLTQSLGQGAGERPEIGGHQIEFNSTDIIVTVVQDSMVASVVSAIIDAAHTGEKGDGKIFVTDLTDAIRIRTGERGEEAI